MFQQFFKFILIISVLAAEAAMASPMIKKHIFSPSATPEAESGGNGLETVQHALLAKKLTRELNFTGIVKFGKICCALIMDKRHKANGRIFHEGDMIRNMVVEKIGSNYLVLSNKKEKVRLNLYTDNKQRPAKLTVSKKTIKGGAIAPGLKKSKNDRGSTGITPKTDIATSSSTKAVTGKKQNAVQADNNTKIRGKLHKPSGIPIPSGNTFLKMIQKSQREQQVNPEFHNKFMELLNKAKNQQQ